MSFLLAFLKRQFISWPPKPTLTYKDRTVIITGASSGLGLEAARTLLAGGAAQIIIACRDISKGEAAKKNILAGTTHSENVIQVWKLDLNSYASVLAFGERVKTELPRVDALIANAAVMKTSFNITEQDEETVTTNVVSTALLAVLVYPKLKEAAEKFDVDTHLTFVGSELYEMAMFKESKAPPGEIFKSMAIEKTTNIRDRYSVSKVLILLVMQQLAELHPLPSSTNKGGVIMNVVAPGLCKSDLHRDFDGAATILAYIFDLLARPTEVGARTLVYGAGASRDSHGQYLPDCKITTVKGLACGKGGVQLRKRVWDELSVKLEEIQSGVLAL